MAHKTFGAVTDDPKAKLRPGPTFDLEGGPPTSKEKWSESFTCVPVAPAGVLDDLARMVRVDVRGNQVYDSPSILRFLVGVLIDADLDRFDDLVHSKDRVVPLEVVADVAMWLMEETVGHPSTPPSS